jgi:hypothetical protein
MRAMVINPVVKNNKEKINYISGKLWVDMNYDDIKKINPVLTELLLSIQPMIFKTMTLECENEYLMKLAFENVDGAVKTDIAEIKMKEIKVSNKENIPVIEFIFISDEKNQTLLDNANKELEIELEEKKYKSLFDKGE